MTGRTDEKTGGQRRVAAPGAGTASPAGLAGVGAPCTAHTVRRDPEKGVRRTGRHRKLTDTLPLMSTGSPVPPVPPTAVTAGGVPASPSAGAASTTPPRVRNRVRFSAACITALFAITGTAVAFVTEGESRTQLLTLAATAIASVVLFIVRVSKRDFVIGGIGIILPLYYLVAQQVSNFVDPDSTGWFTNFINSVPMPVEAVLLLAVLVTAMSGVKDSPRYSWN
jgi:hypothetical protein